MCACTGKNEWSWLAAMPMPSATPATNQTTASRTNQLAMPCMECSSNLFEEHSMQGIANWFVRLAVVWFVAGVALGIGMAASHDHSFFPVHAHINLLGWVSLSLFAGFYRLWPQR